MNNELWLDQTEETMVDRALRKLRETTGINMRLTAREVCRDQTLARVETHHEIDAIGCLEFDGVQKEVVFEVKKYLTTATLNTAVMHLRAIQEPHELGVIVAEYVNPNIAERLREQNVGFLDTVGNAYLNAHPVLIYIKGQRPVEKPQKTEKRRAFQPTGLKMIFAFMQKPELLNAPYREIADRAGVAVGTVGKVLNDLRHLGFVIELGKGNRRLQNKRKLLDRWVEAYPEVLRPKLLVGRFDIPDDPDWKNKLEMENFRGYLGGEVAAEIITGYLRPELLTVYLRAKPAMVQAALRLRGNPNGKFEMLKAFWRRELDNLNDPYLTPALLVYADLLATGDPRNIETAQMVYENEIARLIRED